MAYCLCFTEGVLNTYVTRKTNRGVSISFFIFFRLIAYDMGECLLCGALRPVKNLWEWIVAGGWWLVAWGLGVGTGERVSMCKFVRVMVVGGVRKRLATWLANGGFWARNVGGGLSKLYALVHHLFFSMSFYVSLHTCYTSDSLCLRVMMEYSSCLKGGGFIRILGFYYLLLLLLPSSFTSCAAGWSIVLVRFFLFFLAWRSFFFYLFEAGFSFL